jgi:cysteine desulfurase/selenocysteine lyase
VLVTGLEHHSNIVPWQMVCEQTGARLVVAPIDDRGDVPLAEIERRIGERTRLVAVAHVSNALGTVLPVAEIARIAHERGAKVVIDGAQGIVHGAVDVQALGCDFYCFSGHKMCGPTGIGVLYGRESLLQAMPPWQGGGDMILAVRFEGTVYNALPHKFEAGTPHIAGAIGLGAAVDYLEELGLDRIAAAEHELLSYATARLSALPGLRIIGTAPEKCAVVSFTVDGIHPHDLGTILDHEAVAIRTGHHCAMPVMDFFEVPATARASMAFYNTRAEIDRLVDALQLAQEMLG